LSVFTERGGKNLNIHNIDTNDVLRTLWMALQLIIFSTGYWFLKRSNAARIAQLESEKSKSETEKNLAISRYAHLQAQINPHFLFNSLNFIYSSVMEISPDASQGILLLSEIMRYSLGKVAEDGKLPLWDEVEHIDRFIQLMQLRFSKRLCLTYNINIQEQYKTYRVPSMLLLTFVENVFKHGELTVAEHPALISISVNDDMLVLHTENYIRQTKNLIPSDHIGLQNVTSRLNDYYPKEGDFDLLLNEIDNNFHVDLKIRL